MTGTSRLDTCRMPGIVWWEIETPDPLAFQRFHAELSGWRFEPAFAGTALGADYWIIRDGEVSIGGLQRASAGVRPSAGVRLYIEVADLEGTLRRIESLGGRIERRRTELGGDDRWFATALDATGVSFGLWTASPQAGPASN
jgi:predicted enzyme related to lactoylglutathione lyase